MQKIKTCLSNIAAVSPRSIGYLIIVGGWVPIYQVFRRFEIVGEELSGVFLTAGIVSAIATFTFDYVGLRVRAKRRNNR